MTTRLLLTKPSAIFQTGLTPSGQTSSGITGNNHLIDEEIMRYLRFLAEVRAWQQKLQVNHLSLNDAQELARLAQSLLGPNAEHTGASANWICRALDVWLEEAAPGQHKPRHVQALFEQWFTRASTTATEPLRVFNFRISMNVRSAWTCSTLAAIWLRHPVLASGAYACCSTVCCTGSWPKFHQKGFAPRLRLLRNLIEASQDDIRAGERNNMPELLKDVELIMSDGPLADIKAFNQVQVIHEVANEFLKAHPSLQGTLYHLEDHELLRGGLTVFDLNPAQHANTFAQRAAQFSALFAQPPQPSHGRAPDPKP